MIDIHTTKAKYLVIDLNTYEMREENSGPIGFFAIFSGNTCKTTELWLRRIEPGSFMMGSPENELGRSENETRHKVTITKPFYIGVFEVTQKQCQLIMGYQDYEYSRKHIRYATKPADVSYNYVRGSKKGSSWPNNSEVDEGSFMGILRNKLGLDFDLPTEAQWEYACRAGTETALNNGHNLSNKFKDYNLDKIGCGGKEEGVSPLVTIYMTGKVGPEIVGSFSPNRWGLYDMHGNVCEWCLDWYGELSESPAIDPKGADTGDKRVTKGGCWLSEACYCRSASRFRGNPADNSGFRVALVQK